MSTRCQIGFYESKEKPLKEFEVLIYRHSDGYPGTIQGREYGVLTDIVPFLRWWTKARGMSDLEYVSARLLQYLCNKYDGAYKKNYEKVSQQKEGFTGILGHGICKTFHWDIAYFYRIYPNVLEVYKANICEKFKDSDFKLLKTIPL